MGGKRPCRICRRWFVPHARAGDRQRVCSRADCRRVRAALRERETDLPWPTALRYAGQEAQAGFAAVVTVVVEGGPFDGAQDRHA